MPTEDKLGSFGNTARIMPSFHWTMSLGPIFFTQKWERVIEATSMHIRVLTQSDDLAICFPIRATGDPYQYMHKNSDEIKLRFHLHNIIQVCKKCSDFEKCNELKDGSHDE